MKKQQQQQHKSLFTDEKNGKVKSVVNSIPSKVLKFASRCWKIFLHTGLNVSQEIVGLSQKVSWCAEVGHIQDLPQAPIWFLFHIYKSMANANSNWIKKITWIDTEESPWIFANKILFISDTKKNPWVMLCLDCPMNNSSSYLNTTVYLAVMLKVSWHIAEGLRVKRFVYQLMIDCKNFITSTLFGEIPYQIILGMTTLPLRISSFLYHLQVSLK